MSEVAYEINEKFKSFLPELSPAERMELKKNIAENGIQTPIVLWRDPATDKYIIIDGHNRHEIGTELGIEIPTATREFKSEDDVLVWILVNQLGRRNLHDRERTLFVGKLYNLRKQMTEKAPKSEENGQFESKPEEEKHNTAAEVGEEFGMSEKTVRRAGQIAEAIEVATPEQRQDFLERKIGKTEFVETVLPPPLPPVPVEPVYEKDRDAITAFVEEQGVALSGLIRDAIQKFERIKTTPRPNGQFLNPVILGQKYNLLNTSLRNLLHELNELRFLYICIACEGKGNKVGGGCDACIGGLVNHDTYQSQVKQEEKNKKFRGSRAVKKENGKTEETDSDDDGKGNA